MAVLNGTLLGGAAAFVGRKGLRAGWKSLKGRLPPGLRFLLHFWSLTGCAALATALCTLALAGP